MFPRRFVESIVEVHRRDRAFLPTAVVFGLLLLLVQWAGGAWSAEFDGYPDESAQFVTGRMLWEYVHKLPAGNPIAWAGQYYLHYPKVAAGHWPPAYHIAEAGWSLLFGSSRVSAMWLQWFFGAAVLMCLFRIARRRMPLAVIYGILLLTVATPVFQQGLEETMSELCCMLFSILFMQGVIKMLEFPGSFSVWSLLLPFAAAALTKGTAVCLLPVPGLAVLLSGRGWHWHISRWQVAATACVLAICILWFAFTIDIVYWAGMTTSIPWPIFSLVGLLGWGFLGISFFGCSRDPLPVAAASMVVSAVLVSLGLRAMNEPRHWIIVLAPVLLLAGLAVTRFRPPISGALMIAGILFFPWHWFRQSPNGYGELLRQIKLPARMLVSSARASGEGAWIAEVALAERYPASLVVRGSKVIAESGWNGENYRLKLHSPSEVTRRLDELAIEIVVLDAPSIHSPPDHELLKRTLEKDSAWQVCCAARNQLAYRRVKPPAYPRQPLVLEAGGRYFSERLSSAPR
jgi:hypothetical protein